MPILVQTVAWHRLCDKPLSDPTLAGCSDIYAPLVLTVYCIYLHVLVLRWHLSVLWLDIGLSSALNVYEIENKISYDKLLVTRKWLLIISWTLTKGRPPWKYIVNLIIVHSFIVLCFAASWWFRARMQLILCTHMVTSSDGNVFRATGPLCGESTGYRWIPFTKDQ